MGELIPVEEKQYALRVVQDTNALMQRKAELQDVVEKYLKPETDFGLIPGTGNKPALFKAGAEKLMDVYGLAADPVIESKVEDYDKGLFDYTVKAYVKTRDGKLTLSSALGSCSSFESKYRYITKNRSCPECNSEAIMKSKYADKKTGEMGYYCYDKKGGCGANFPPSDKRITEQEVGKKQREDMADIKNTILKMAEKRAVVAAVIRATRSAELFTQDLEDMSDYLPEDFITVEVKEVKKEEGKQKGAATSTAAQTAGKSEETGKANASNAQNSSEKSSTSQSGTTTGKQADPKPAKSAENTKDSAVSTANAPSASGAQPVNDLEFASLKQGIWKAFNASCFAILGEENKQKNVAEFKSMLLKKFEVNSDDAAQMRVSLTPETATKICEFFGANPAQ